MVNLDSLSFDLKDYKVHTKEADRILWFNSMGVANLMRFSQRPPDWPFDLRDFQGATKFYGNQCAENKGVMLSMDILNVDKVEVLRGLFKYRAPKEGSLAMMYVGILWIPFSNFNYQINVEALEHGVTGFREAAVAMLEPKDYSNPKILEETPWPEAKSEEPIVVKSAEEMFERMSQASVRKLPSDDEQFDSKFPDHPLSLVRARLSNIIDTMKINKMFWQSLKPFRIGSN